MCVTAGGGIIAAPRKPPGQNLLRLIYASCPTRDLTPEDLAAIGARSAAHNRALGLTGLLLCQGNSFHAVLEGVRARVLRRMEVIITDSRHRNLRILSETEIPARRIENWSFADVPRSMKEVVADAPRDEFAELLARRLR